MTINLVGGGEGWGGAAARADTNVWTGNVMEPGTFSKPGVRGPGCGACERVSVGRGCGKNKKTSPPKKKKSSGKRNRVLHHSCSGAGLPGAADSGPACVSPFPEGPDPTPGSLTCVMVSVVLLTCWACRAAWARALTTCEQRRGPRFPNSAR